MVLALIMREMKWRFLEIPYTNRRYVEMLWLERRLSLYLQTNQSSLYWFQF